MRVEVDGVFSHGEKVSSDSGSAFLYGSIAKLVGAPKRPAAIISDGRWLLLDAHGITESRRILVSKNAGALGGVPKLGVDEFFVHERCSERWVEKIRRMDSQMCRVAASSLLTMSAYSWLCMIAIAPRTYL